MEFGAQQSDIVLNLDRHASGSHIEEHYDESAWTEVLVRDESQPPIIQHATSLTKPSSSLTKKFEHMSLAEIKKEAAAEQVKRKKDEEKKKDRTGDVGGVRSVSDKIHVTAQDKLRRDHKAEEKKDEAERRELLKSLAKAEEATMLSNLAGHLTEAQESGRKPVEDECVAPSHLFFHVQNEKEDKEREFSSDLGDDVKEEFHTALEAVLKQYAQKE